MNKSDTALILVDFQNAPMRAVASQPLDQLKRNVLTLAQAAKIMKLPVLLLAAPLPGDAGNYFLELSNLFSKDQVVDHKSNNGWRDPDARERIIALNRTNLVFAGIATDVGAGLAAMSAKADGFNTFLIGDCSGTLNPMIEQMAFLRVSQAGVQLLGLVGFIGEIQGNYHAPDGAELLKLIDANLMRNSGIFTSS